MPRTPATPHRAACLLSPHPLVLAELRGLLRPSRFRVLACRLDLLAPDLDRLAVPRASVYVVDGYAPRPLTEALLVRILSRFPPARLVVLAEAVSESNAFPLLRLGVKGLLSYADARRQLPQVLQAVARGGYWVPRSLLSRFVDSMLTGSRGRRLLPPPGHLSRREREVLDLLLEDLSNKEIASKLPISERTVKFHVSKLLRKFGVERRQQLILRCLRASPPGP